MERAGAAGAARRWRRGRLRRESAAFLAESAHREEGVTGRLAGFREAVAKFVYGMSGYEFARHATEMRHENAALFMVVTMGDLIGVPVLPPIYSLRLLPYAVPEIATWKRHLARRREFWEKEEYDLHGV